MVDVVQWLEHRIVIPGVVGSNPIIHPSRRRFQIESAAFSFCLNSYNIVQLRKWSERWLSPEFFSFKPADIIEALGLKNPIFSASTNYGHFGKADLPWEKQDSKKLDKLKS